MNDTKNGWIGLVFDKNQDCKNYKMNIVLGEFKDKVKFYYKNEIKKIFSEIPTK